jgi:hypothetical protein
MSTTSTDQPRVPRVLAEILAEGVPAISIGLITANRLEIASTYKATYESRQSGLVQTRELGPPLDLPRFSWTVESLGFLGTPRRSPLRPRVIAAGGDTQQRAHRGDREDGLILAHEPEPFDGIAFVSRANQAAAFERISLSSLSWRFSRRS